MYVSDIALILVRAFSAALEEQTGKIEATRKQVDFSMPAKSRGVRRSPTGMWTRDFVSAHDAPNFVRVASQFSGLLWSTYVTQWEPVSTERHP